MHVRGIETEAVGDRLCVQTVFDDPVVDRQD